MNKSGPILIIGGGVLLLYVAYTGYLASAWNGIQGKCPGTGTVSAPAKSGSLKDQPVHEAGDVPSPARLQRGWYQVSPTGGLQATDMGGW